MIDHYGREIDYLRISITDKCNLRCVYCMPKEGVKTVSHEEILSYEEILRITKVLTTLGIKKIKVTGGEPLVRRECMELIRALKALPGIEKVTLTTNGVLLKDLLPQLASAGIDGINISLDTLDPDEFITITRRDHFAAILEAIQETRNYPEIPFKINCVPIARQESMLLRIAQLAKEYPVHVRFIEMMPIGYGKEYPFRSEDSILNLLSSSYGAPIPYTERLGNGPCHYYYFEGFQGKIGFISAMTHKFCDQCNRIRLTSDGFLKACLQYQTGISVRDLMRKGITDTELRKEMEKVILSKPECHRFLNVSIDQEEQKLMAQIGG